MAFGHGIRAVTAGFLREGEGWVGAYCGPGCEQPDSDLRPVEV
jgi:hypothetical protein